MGTRKLQVVSAAALTLAVAQVASAVNFPEIEPNNTRATATPAGPMNPGDTITGSSPSSTTDPDFFNVLIGASAPAIYRHEMAFNAATVFGRIRGHTQTNGVINLASDATLQTNPGTAPFENVWFSFGRPHTVPFNVNNNTATPDYTGTYSRSTVTPIAGPTVAPGPVTISTLGQTTVDTDLWLYDGAFNAIPLAGNDDANTTTLQSNLTRTLTPGTYYVAISQFDLSNNQSSPPDDAFDDGNVTSFPDYVVDSAQGTVGQDFDMTINGTPVTATRQSRFGVTFVQFNVIPEPASLGLFGAAGLGLLARRRRA